MGKGRKRGRIMEGKGEGKSEGKEGEGRGGDE